MLYYVSDNESGCYVLIQRYKDLWNMDLNMEYEFSDGYFLSNVLLWTVGKVDIQNYF